jgi:hypothetical protein
MPRVLLALLKDPIHEAKRSLPTTMWQSLWHSCMCMDAPIPWWHEPPPCLCAPCISLYLELAAETFVKGIYSSQEARHTWAAIHPATHVIQPRYP